MPNGPSSAIKDCCGLRHPPPPPIHEINGIAFRDVDAQVDQDEHDLVPDDIRSYVEEVQ
ncbi:hypothetical protein F5888DRAFT_1810060 [Russula emetica]|nr:hypothetical protein F5888DRAFT_1810060 [Russula emetica]